MPARLGTVSCTKPRTHSEADLWVPRRPERLPAVCFYFWLISNWQQLLRNSSSFLLCCFPATNLSQVLCHNSRTPFKVTLLHLAHIKLKIMLIPTMWTCFVYWIPVFLERLNNNTSKLVLKYTEVALVYYETNRARWHLQWEFSQWYQLVVLFLK